MTTVRRAGAYDSYGKKKRGVEFFAKNAMARKTENVPAGRYFRLTLFSRRAGICAEGRKTFRGLYAHVRTVGLVRKMRKIIKGQELIRSRLRTRLVPTREKEGRIEL